MTIPKLTPYTGQVANPDGSQTQTEFTQNMFDQLSYEAQLATQLDATIDGINQAVVDVELDVIKAQNSADAAQAAANFEGDFTVGVTNAIKGKSYLYNGDVWLCLQNTTSTPSSVNAAWKLSVGEQYVTKSQEQQLPPGSKIYPNDGSYLENGMTVTAGTTHLRVLVGGDTTIVAMSPVASGAVSLLTETSATIGGVLVQLAKKQDGITGGVSIVFDDANLVTKTDLMPVAVSEDFKASLAMYHSGMAASYDFVSMREALDFRKNVNGELLSHSMNSLALNSAVDLTYGENLIKTSATEFSQFGFRPRGFVAPNSTLDDKFRPQLEQSFDFAFIRSYGAGAGLLVNNNFGDDRYNLARIALTDSVGTEIITLEQAKSYVDQAKVNDSYICFYAHTLPSYLADLMQYIKDNYVALNPSEWVGNHWGLNKDVGVKSQENLLVNSGFELINADDTSPYRWSYNPNTLVSPSVTITDNEGGASIDLSSGVGVGGETATFSQNYESGRLSNLTPLCFSVYARSLATSNTDVRLAIYAKDASNVTLASTSKTFEISGNRQRLEISQGFIPNSNIVRFLVEVTVIAKGAGGVRAIMDSPQLERSGYATSYKQTKLDKYYNVLRRVTGLSVAPNTDTLINFDASLEGTNYIFDLATGEAKPDDGRNYLLQCNFGLQNMVAGDIIECHLLINGVASRKAMFTAFAGTNILNPSWSVRGDGRTYAIGIRHNSSASRAITAYGDAVMTITASENK